MRAMKFFSVRTTLIVLIASLVIFGNAQAEIVPGRYIVVFHDDVVNPRAAATSIAQANGLAVGHVYSSALRGFSASIPDQALQGVMRNPKVAYIEPDLIVHAVGQTLPTGVNRIDVDQNATAKIDGIDERVDVDIAIIDTGIDIDHPDLEVVGGIHYYTVWPFFQFWDGNYDDDNGHGTHVAGIAAALDNDYGVVGVAPGARLWAVKVLDASGSGYVSDLVAGIDWVAANAANIEIANMSLSWQGNSSAARTAIINSVAKGVVYMVAASNESQDVYGPDGVFGTSDDYEPASYPEVATIAALTDTDGQPGGNGPPSGYSGKDRNGDGVDDGVDDSFAWFSNYSNSSVSYNPVISPGAAIDLLLPGVSIYSTVTTQGDEDIAHPSGYNSISGTSMASPHGAGLAALYIADNGRATNAAGVYAIRQALIDNGVQQTDIRGLAVQNDPDVNNEHIGWGGDAVGSLPTVAWVNPVDGSTLAGTVDIWISASDAEDAEGSLTVEWRVDGGDWQSAYYNSGTGYYEASWDSTTVSDGNHTLDARGTDSDGNAVTDSIIVATENVNDPPVVSWINPGNGDTVAGTAIAIQINASDDLDTAGSLTVEWRVDGGVWQPVADYTGDYYEDSWDSTAVSDGSHTLGARATDSGSNVSASDITVTVNNIPDPSVSLYAYDISWSEKVNRRSSNLVMTVDVNLDSNGIAEAGDSPAIGIPVDLWLIHDTNRNGSFGETLDDLFEDENWLASGVTDKKGIVKFTLSGAYTGDYKATVGPLLPGADPPWHDIPFGDNPDWYFGFPNGGEADPSAEKLTASATQLDQNYPNPPNPETWIPFRLSKPERVVIRIYNAAGRLVRTLDLGAKAPGAYVSKGKAAYWDGRNEAGEKVTSGIYFYVMEAGSFRAMRKMIILK